MGRWIKKVKRLMHVLYADKIEFRDAMDEYSCQRFNVQHKTSNIVETLAAESSKVAQNISSQDKRGATAGCCSASPHKTTRRNCFWLVSPSSSSSSSSCCCTVAEMKAVTYDLWQQLPVAAPLIQNFLYNLPRFRTNRKIVNYEAKQRKYLADCGLKGMEYVLAKRKYYYAQNGDKYMALALCSL